VQTKGPDGDIEDGADTDPTVQWDGPLIVLASRFSASASEILAGALQDYGRAVVVGDTSTFGKGTVQNVLPLARMMDRNGLSYSYDPGALKVTIRKFYRPSGASTQLRGVASDLVLPSPSDLNDVSESSLTDPLKWDTIPAARYEAVNQVKPYLPALRETSTKRLSSGKDFAFLREEVALIKKSVANKSVSLNEAERRKEIAEGKARKSQREQQAKALKANRPTTYELTLKTSASAGLPPPVSATGGSASHVAAAPAGKGDKGDELEGGLSGRSPLDEIILNESVQILADYVGLLEGATAKKTPTP
jgi:carboxyl-terminal processing protease